MSKEQSSQETSKGLGGFLRANRITILVAIAALVIGIIIGQKGKFYLSVGCDRQARTRSTVVRRSYSPR